MGAVLMFVMILSREVFAAEKSRPMGEMHRSCLDFKLNLSQEFKIWKERPLKAHSAEEFLTQKRTQLSLVKQEQIRFLKTPEKLFPVKGESYGGVFYFQVPKSGKFRISAGSKVWSDVVEVDTNKIIEAAEFEMQTGCDRIFKTVIFDLTAKTKYALQVNSSVKPAVDFLITAE